MCPPHAHTSCLQLKKAPYPQWSSGIVFKGHIKYSCKIKKHHIHTQSLVIKRVRISINNKQYIAIKYGVKFRLSQIKS
jgi:hypothetical protein